MRPHINMRAEGPTVYVDAMPLSSEHLTGIGRYTARISMALTALGARVRFFAHDHELRPPPGLGWSPDQDLDRWGARLWRDRRLVPLADVPGEAVGLWTATRPPERRFPVELSVLHDLTPLILPSYHEPRIRAQFQFFYARSLLSSDGALAVSHSTKADAGWLTDFAQDRIIVAHPGPSQCILRHRHGRRVSRRRDVGLVLSASEPRDNVRLVIDWFRSSTSLPDGCELWWASRAGDSPSPGLREEIQRGGGGRRIRFLGAVSDRRLCKLYRSVGWSVCPSLYEGFGFPVLDALRHGLPVLAGGHSSLREFSHRGVYFFDPHDAATLDRAWVECRDAGPHVVSKEELDDLYDWDRVARTILETATDHSPATAQRLAHA
jgi:glycosyltransferase involved in cell wall biosynthesis